MLSFAGCLLLFFGISLGLAWPVVSRLTLDPAERLTASAALSLLGVFLFGWAVYVFALPLPCFWILPVAAVLGLITGWHPLVQTLRDRDAAGLAAGQIIVTLWSVAWLALILNYSGGGWQTDWHSHLQRAWFFLDHGPHNILFNGFDPLTSRPPLANIVNGVLLAITQRDFAHYEFVSTLFGSLAFLPAGLLARRFGGGRAVVLLTLLFMVNPMYAQNVTYAWTKLPAAFFTLSALYFFLRACDDRSPRVHAVLFALTLAAGLLTHYSAGPYAVILGGAWLALGWRRRHEADWWRTTLFATLSGALVLAVWFGWAFAVFGVHGSLLTNTSITDQAPAAGAQLQTVLLNVRDTLVPHFLRTVDFELLAQRSSSGWWRDWFFQLYQVNFFFAFGSVAWMAILVGLLRQWRTAPIRGRAFWSIFILGNTILGLAVHGARDTWGLAHICLQPLVLLGLAFLAAQWPRLERPWRLLLIAGATVDFALGLVLQFGTEAFALERWLSPGRPVLDAVANYTITAQMNFYAKAKNHWLYFGDLFLPSWPIVVGLLGALLLLALVRANRSGDPAGAPHQR